MNIRIIGVLITFSIIFLSGCSTLKQSDDDVIFRDPDNGTNLAKINEYAKYDSEKQLDKLWLYASFSADVYLPIADAARLIKVTAQNLLPDSTSTSLQPSVSGDENSESVDLPVKNEQLLINKYENWKLYCGRKSPQKPPQSVFKECKFMEGVGIGLEYEVWINEVENETVISFRGTDFDEKEDWRSNLRWFVPIKEKDQYDIVGNITPKIIQEIKSKYNNMDFITTGHSLGGGLAQRAAYSSEDVQLVYAFDPSMVTGFFDVFSIFDFLKYHEQKEINIYRVFEHGEVLAYPRWIMKILFPLSSQNPRIAELRFNYNEGEPVAQHSMSDLAIKLRKNFMIEE